MAGHDRVPSGALQATVLRAREGGGRPQLDYESGCLYGPGAAGELSGATATSPPTGRQRPRAQGMSRKTFKAIAVVVSATFFGAIGLLQAGCGGEEDSGNDGHRS